MFWFSFYSRYCSALNAFQMICVLKHLEAKLFRLCFEFLLDYRWEHLFLSESHQPAVQDAVNDPSSSYLSSDFCAIYCKSFRFGSADLRGGGRGQVWCGGEECCWLESELFVNKQIKMCCRNELNRSIQNGSDLKISLLCK